MLRRDRLATTRHRCGFNAHVVLRRGHAVTVASLKFRVARSFHVIMIWTFIRHACYCGDTHTERCSPTQAWSHPTSFPPHCLVSYHKNKTLRDVLATLRKKRKPERPRRLTCCRGRRGNYSKGCLSPSCTNGFSASPTRQMGDDERQQRRRRVATMRGSCVCVMMITGPHSTSPVFLSAWWWCLISVPLPPIRS